MGVFCPSSKVTTLYKAVYIEKNVGTRSPRLLTHMVIKEVKSEVGRAKKIFFTILVHWIDTLQILVVRTQNPLVQRKKKLPKQIGWGWLRCHDENRWMMNRQYPKTAATLVTNRGMFLANCTKHVIFDLVKFNPGKFFIPCLLKSTETRLFILLFFSYLKSYFLRLFETFSYSFPYARFSRGRRNSSCATFRTPRILRHF